MHVTAIIAAGGRGRRFGAALPKQLLRVGGRPILQWSVDAFLACGEVSEVIVVVPPALAADPPAYLRSPRITLVEGGERRQDSVANGFDAVPGRADVVLVHDAARPFVDRNTILRAVEAADEAGAAIAALGASDTVKWAPPRTEAGDARTIERTLDRTSVFLAQTPQAFRRSVLADAVALGRSGLEATDESALAEQAGHRVRVVEGDRRNIKVTTADDLVVAEALAAEMSRAEALLHRDPNGATKTSEDDAQKWGRPSGPPSIRVGSGYDLHRLVEGRPLILGGVTIPFERGPAGHSDADVLSHAITDAILGAASLGDIGQRFPDTDPKWKDASSIALLAEVAAFARERGFAVANVDATVVAERPKLGPHRSAIVNRLSEALSVAASAVSVKAKTNEGVDATGRGEAIAVHAVVLLEQRSADSGQQTADQESTK
jgi:2-C-methyl-D-erythritol 4-phosphate cytidylyltransferase/2-C-methyl-D-erythritol 2,4-cyclodiphosphate synthase